MGRHKTTPLDKARDELMSHIVRCEVLDAVEDHRWEWLEETMDYMAGRYPQLSDLQLAHLETIGRQYLRPAIQHGARFNAVVGRNPAARDDAPAEQVAEEAGDDPVPVEATPAEAERVAA